MNDIDQLEASWRRYRRKRILKPITYFLVFALIGVGVYFLSVTWMQRSATQASSESNASKQPSPHTTPAMPQTASLATEIPSVAGKDNPSGRWRMEFADDKDKNTTPEVDVPPAHVDIEVSPKKAENTVNEIEKRFRFARDKDDALFLARYYYDKKEYKTALNWALETNKLDSDIEESWLIFGQSKAHLGQRMEAIRVLQAYFDRTGSKRTKSLLDKIRRGKAF
jgi:tetratricopeptide (TPR) repeat protein